VVDKRRRREAAAGKFFFFFFRQFAWRDEKKLHERMMISKISD